MFLKTTCDACRKTATFGLTKVRGKYLCSDCISNPKRSMRYYCNACHNHTATALMKGSGWIEFVLYFFYILPGVVYSIWRRAGAPNVCPVCKHAGLVPESAAKPAPTQPLPPRRDEIECPHCAELILAKASLCKHCGQRVA